MKNFLIFFLSVLFNAPLHAQIPVGYYPLDGNANDFSGNNYNGTIVGNPFGTLNRYNQPTSAMLFNGNTDYIVLPNSFDFPTRSVIVWFYATQIGGSDSANLVYSNDGPSTQNGLTAILTQTIQGQNQILIQADQIQYSATISPYTWYQAAVVRTPAVVKMYLNGTFVYSANNPNGNHSQNGTVETGIIGCDRSFSEKFFGKIDNLMIYDSALQDSMVENNYTSLINIHELEPRIITFTEGQNILYKVDDEFISEISAIHLYNSVGEVIAKTSVINGAGIINNSDLGNGLYFVTYFIGGENKRITKKVIITM